MRTLSCTLVGLVVGAVLCGSGAVVDAATCIPGRVDTVPGSVCGDTFASGGDGLSTATPSVTSFFSTTGGAAELFATINGGSSGHVFVQGGFGLLKGLTSTTVGADDTSHGGHNELNVDGTVGFLDQGPLLGPFGAPIKTHVTIDVSATFQPDGGFATVTFLLFALGGGSPGVLMNLTGAPVNPASPGLHQETDLTLHAGDLLQVFMEIHLFGGARPQTGKAVGVDMTHTAALNLDFDAPGKPWDNLSRHDYSSLAGPPGPGPGSTTGSSGVPLPGSIALLLSGVALLSALQGPPRR